MGVDGLNSIAMYGSGANFGLGQSTNVNGPWPRTNVSSYRRTIDFTQPALRASAATHGDFPWWVTHDPAAATEGAFNQNITPAQNNWAQQLNIWVTPWSFLKGAAPNNATVRAQTIGGRKYNVVTWSPASGSGSI